MKTPAQWLLETHKIESTFIDESFKMKWLELFEAIQKDALSDPFANTTDQQEFEIVKSIAMSERARAYQLYDEMIKMRNKWHEARKQLRISNKKIESNALVAKAFISWGKYPNITFSNQTKTN
jgi:hypothetical protein